MKDIKQIYRDKTGWREVNHNKRYFEGLITETRAWQLFEQSITYHPFPNAPDTNEIVEAYLQWQSLAPNSLHPTWKDVEDSENNWRVDFCKRNGCHTRQVWILADRQEAKEEIKPCTGKFIDSIDYTFSRVGKQNLADKRSPSSQNVEVSADEIIQKVYSDSFRNNTPTSPTELHIRCMEQYAVLKTSQLQSELQDKEKEIERLKTTLQEIADLHFGHISGQIAYEALNPNSQG